MSTPIAAPPARLTEARTELMPTPETAATLLPGTFCNHREVARLQRNGGIVGGISIVSAVWFASKALENGSGTLRDGLLILCCMGGFAALGVWMIAWVLRLPLWTIVCGNEGFATRREGMGIRTADTFHRWDAVTATAVGIVKNDEHPDEPYLTVETTNGPLLGKETVGLFEEALVTHFNLKTPHMPYTWQPVVTYIGKHRVNPTIWERVAREGSTPAVCTGDNQRANTLLVNKPTSYDY